MSDDLDDVLDAHLQKREALVPLDAEELALVAGTLEFCLDGLVARRRNGKRDTRTTAKQEAVMKQVFQKVQHYGRLLDELAI